MKCDLVADPKPVLDPNDPSLASSLAAALSAHGLIALAAGIVSCTDSGVPNGGDGGGNLVLVTTAFPHGLIAGQHVVLSGTPYDGDREAEPVSLAAFYILNVPFSVAAPGGSFAAVPLP